MCFSKVSSTLLPAALLFITVAGVTSAQETPAKTGAASGNEKLSAYDLVDRCIERYQMGNLAGALEDCSRAITLEPNYSIAYFRRGVVYYTQGNYNAALKDYNEADSLRPKDADIVFARGVARYQLGDEDGALADYNSAIDNLKVDDADAYLDRGLVRYHKKDLDGAIADYTKAIKLHHLFGNAYVNRAQVLSEKGDLEGATADYEKAVQLLPADPATFFNLGMTREKRGDLDGALHDYTEAIKLNPNLESAYYKRGLIRYGKSDWDGAGQDFADAARLNPNDSEAHLGAGLVASKKGGEAMAIGEFDSAIKLNPNYQEAFYARGIARYKARDLDGAIQDYREAVRLKPEDEHAKYDEGVALLSRAKNAQERGDLDAATRDTREALGLHAKGAEPLESVAAAAFVDQGAEHYKRSEYSAAVDDFNQAIEADPKLAVAYYDRSLARFKTRDFAGAKGDYDEAKRLAPADAATRFGLPQQGTTPADRTGYECYKKSDFPGALSAYSSSIQTDATNSNAYYGRALARYQLHDYKGAVDDCSAAIDKANGNKTISAQAYDVRGRARMELPTPDLNGAMQDFNEALRLQPGYINAERNLAAIQTSATGCGAVMNPPAEQLSSVIEDCTRAIIRNPKDVRARLARAAAMSRAGDWSSALQDYNEVNRLKPTDPDLLAKMYAGRGLARYNTGNRGGALQDYNRSLHITHENADALNNRGAYYTDAATRKNLKLALSDYDAASKLHPGDAEILLNRAEAKRGLHDLQGAMQDYNEVIRLKSDYALAYYCRSLARQALKDQSGADADLALARQYAKPADAKTIPPGR